MPPEHQPGTQPRAVAIWQESGDKLVVQAANRKDETCIFIKGEDHVAVDLPLDNSQFLQILNTAFGLDK